MRRNWFGFVGLVLAAVSAGAQQVGSGPVKHVLLLSVDGMHAVDVSYDRSLDAPAKTTGNGVAAGPCTACGVPTGTTTEYEEGIDRDRVS